MSEEKKDSKDSKESESLDESKTQPLKSEKDNDVDKEESSEVEIPSKFKELVEKIESMSVLELSELIKILEKKFGVSAQVMVPAAAVAQSSETNSGEQASAESALKNIELKSAGDQKIQVIKVIREALGIGLKDAKDLVDSAPKVIKEGLKPEKAEELKKKLEEAGAVVEIK